MSHSFTLPIPVLATNRLILREPREADFPAMLAFNDSPRAAFVGGGRDRQWVWRGLLANLGHWALRGHGFFSVDTHAGDFVGRVGVIFHDGWDEPELGWHLFDGFEGQGYGVEAARAAKADYHARISPAPLISYIDPANPKSEALAKRLGAAPERQAVFFDKTINVWRHAGPTDAKQTTGRGA
ncbi:GNAT family N-acetyltransferase [Tabrizicola sp.]|jgi:RimJ/RimL family protein N-acetyltransferase|uniref:GNAT family N-acetyltransferase n=1 Tax=Tabrizicola sp. TaxID=2005166 RepID=UPI0035AFAD9C